MSGLLKPGGHLIIIDFDKNEQVVSPDVHNGFHQSSLCGFLRSLSLEVVLSETFYNGERLFMNKDASMFIIDCKKAKGLARMLTEYAKREEIPDIAAFIDSAWRAAYRHILAPEYLASMRVEERIKGLLERFDSSLSQFLRMRDDSGIVGVAVFGKSITEG
jgi:hypothetical protein